MIYINVLNKCDNTVCNNLEYDLRALLKAFYPSEEITNKPQQTAFMNAELVCDDVTVYFSLKSQEKTLISREFCVSDDLKDKFDNMLYEELSGLCGRELPWGMLTGIRPTKIVYSLIDKGMSDEQSAAYLTEHYKVSRRKALLAVSIANKEKTILDKIDYKDGYSLYIGIPFCPTTCLYCSFTSYPIALFKKKTDMYLDCLIKELQYVSKRFNGKHPDTVYIGGGTPTTLEANQLDRLLTEIENNFNVSDVLEFTVEAGRPDSVDAEKFEVLRKHGIDRISINPQTMNQKTLDLIGRKHTVDDVCRAFSLARSAGFGNINMDIIVGLPGETKEDVRYTLERIKEMKPDSLTVHSLALKRAAKLNIKKEDYSGYAIENTDEIISMTMDYAKDMGLFPYYMYRQKNMAGNFENVGYSKEGKEGIYNILIMEEKQTITAVGAGASTKLVFPYNGRIERVENVKDVNTYMERIDDMIERKRVGFDMLFERGNFDAG